MLQDDGLEGGCRMSRLVEFGMEDGSTIIAEVDEAELGGGTLRSLRPSEMIEKANTTFEEALAKVKPAAESMIGTLRGLTVPPSEIQVVFGLKLSAAAGAIVAAVGTEANFAITLTWRHEKSEVVPVGASPHYEATTVFREPTS